MTITELIKIYYASLNKKDDAWQELWAKDASFQDASKTLDASGRDAVIASFTPFLKGVISVSIKQLLVEDNTACVIASYVYGNQKGEKMDQDVAEIWEVSEDKLKKLVIYFDLTAYRSFMRH